MILCDIGNTNFHFYEKGKVWKQSVSKMPELEKEKKIFAISVNDEALKRLSSKYVVIDLQSKTDFLTNYKGLGIDRAVACLAIKDGIVVDAGSAITVDVVKDEKHIGGFILPGILAFQNSYAQISKKLDMQFNFGIDIESLPNNTKDAISFGAIKSIKLIIESICKDNMIYFTGGDGAYFSKFFENCVVDNLLIFKGMQKIIKDNGIC